MYGFFKNYFFINLKDYSSFGFDFPITVVLFCFLIALIFTTVVVNYKRRKIEEMISALTRHKAFDEESAKTLSELHLDIRSYCRILSSEGQLTKMVARVGEKKMSYEEFVALSKTKGYKEEKPELDTARFYIKEEGRDRANRVLEVGVASTLNTVLFCLLLVAVFICLALLMPGILSALNALLGG
jgi:small-conductance mechanosensitive channel